MDNAADKERSGAEAALAEDSARTTVEGHHADPHHAGQDQPEPVIPSEAQAQEGFDPAAAPHAKGFDPIEALKLGSLRLASIIKGEPKQQQAADAAAGAAEDAHEQQGSEVVARLKATAAGLGACAKEQGSRFYQASIKTAASTAEGIKRLAQGEPLQALCRTELAVRPCPQLVLACCTALVSGGGITTERIFKHNPPQELVDRLAATAAGSVCLLPPGASPHAVAALLKQFLLGLPEPVLTYRLLPQFVAAGDHPDSCRGLLQQLPAANASTLRLLMQTCHYANEQAALNEMDSQALAEVLAGCLAWKPPPKPQGSAPGGWQGLTKALTLKPATAGAGTASDAAGIAGSEAGPAGVEGDAAACTDSSAAGGLAEAHRVTPLDDAEAEAVVTVLEYMISHYTSVFGS